MIKRWLVAAIALALGASVSVALLVYANPDRGSIDAFVAIRDIQAGTPLDSSAVALARMRVDETPGLLFTREDGGALLRMRASHDLVSGQLVQRSDATAAVAPGNSRLVYVPISNAPAAAPGSRVDLLALDGPADHPVVEPFALGVEVRSSTAGGMVLVVSAEQAAAFVYAGAAMHLAAVIAEPGAAGGAEQPVTSVQQAIQVAGPQ
jgi:hypothetical protein